MQGTSRTQAVVHIGLAIALIAVGAFITVPFGPVPFTLQTLMVGIVLCLLPPQHSVYAIGGYLALGIVGLPIFSGFRGGIGVLAGPTGGFLVGFLVAMVIIALLRSQVTSRLLASKGSDKKATRNYPWVVPALDAASLLLFSLISYSFGCGWFMVLTGATLEAALAACLVPFIIPDIVKAVAAFVCVQSMRAALEHTFALAK